MIKLTTDFGSLYVQADTVVAIQTLQRFGVTLPGSIIYCKEQRQFEVIESPEEIYALIEDYYTKC